MDSKMDLCTLSAQKLHVLFIWYSMCDLCMYVCMFVGMRISRTKICNISSLTTCTCINKTVSSFPDIRVQNTVQSRLFAWSVYICYHLGLSYTILDLDVGGQIIPCNWFHSICGLSWSRWPIYDLHKSCWVIIRLLPTTSVIMATDQW